MIFILVDETGDPGKAAGASEYFGYSILQVSSDDYHILNFLISQICWLCGSAKQTRWGERPYRILNLLRGLKELANDDIIKASGLYIQKAKYCGAYLNWANYGIPSTEWPHYLRNYVLRHALEFHFMDYNTPDKPVEIILDRVIITEDQKINTGRYLNSETPKPLREKFKIPPILHFTLADSQYVRGLWVAHVLADMLRLQIKGEMNSMIEDLSSFMKTQCFLGHTNST